MMEIFTQDGTESLARCKNMAQVYNVLHYLKDTGEIPTGLNKVTVCRYWQNSLTGLCDMEYRDGAWHNATNANTQEIIPGGVSMAIS